MRFSLSLLPKAWAVPCWLAGVCTAGCGAAQVVPSAQEVKDAEDTGTRLEAQTPTEQAVLAQLGQMPAEQPRSFNGVTVTAGTPYYAASGRQCREMTLEAPGGDVTERVACLEQGVWFFVPDVLAGAPAGRR